MAAIYTAFCTIGKLGNTAQVMHAGIYHAVLPLTTAFLTFPIWPNKLKNTRFAAFLGRSVLGRFYFFCRHPVGHHELLSPHAGHGH